MHTNTDKVTIDTVTPKWFEDNIKSGRNSYQMGLLLGCSREKVEICIKKFDMWDVYAKANTSKMPHFVFHNSEIYNELSKFGPMYYSSCPQAEK